MDNHVILNKIKLALISISKSQNMKRIKSEYIELIINDQKFYIYKDSSVNHQPIYFYMLELINKLKTNRLNFNVDFSKFENQYTDSII